MVLAADGTVLYYGGRNPAPEGIVGRVVFDAVHESSRQAYAAHVREAVEHARTVTFETMAASDPPQRFRVQIAPMPGREFGPAVIAMCANIDAEFEVRTAHQRLCNALESGKEAIMLVDFQTGRFIEVNDTACRQLGYTRAELLELAVWDIVSYPDFAPERWVEICADFARRGGMTVDGIHRRKDESCFPVEVSITPGGPGDTTMLAVVRDTAQRKKAEADLERARHKLGITDRLATVGTLAGGLAHEISNPLTSVLANLEYLGDVLSDSSAGLSAQTRERAVTAVREVGQGAERVREIARHLKTFSRAEDDSVTTVSVCEVLDSAIGIAMNEIRHRARLERDYDARGFVTANEGRLAKAFLSLLVNAAQSIEAGDASANLVQVRTRSRGKSVVVEIRDTGSGIAPEHLGRVFDPFFSTKPRSTGTGMGLSIAHSVITGLGGTIEIKAGSSGGTTVRVRLPTVDGGPARRDPPKSPTVKQGRARVLIIDDDIATGQALAMALRAHDVEVESNGLRAADRMLREEFDVVLCDLMMPDFAGMDVHELVHRENPALADAIVFVTGGAFTPRARSFLQRIPNLVLEKPFDPAVLRQVVLQRLASTHSM